MRKALSLGVICLVAAGCAAKPENISPAFISEAKYDSWDCNALAAERARYDDALAQASTQQRKARSNDTLGVIFLGLPVSTLAGNNAAGEISRLKGEVEALARAQGEKNCYTSPRQASAHPARASNSVTGHFGIEGSTVTSASSVAVVMSDPHGVLINEVTPDSPAARAGITKGDVIQSFNATRITSREELDALIEKTSPGTAATIVIWRDNQLFETTASL